MRTMTSVIVALDALALIVFAVLLATGVLPFRIYIVHTGSMSPTIPSNSAVIVRKGAYSVGQVITFDTSNGPVTHRLIAQNADGSLVTKGDANRTPDPGSVLPSAVVGGVVAAPPMLGYWLTYLKNPLGLASVLLALVVVWLAASAVRSFVDRPRQTTA